MNSTKRRFVALSVLASGTLLASSCSLAEQIVDTIRYALGIVDVWV